MKCGIALDFKNSYSLLREFWQREGNSSDTLQCRQNATNQNPNLKSHLGVSGELERALLRISQQLPLHNACQWVSPLAENSVELSEISLVENSARSSDREIIMRSMKSQVLT
jgi:hypothetical protein